MGPPSRAYEVRIRPSAEREFRALPSGVKQRLEEAMLALAVEPRPQSARPLTGIDGWRLRVGDYRVGYTIEDANRVVTIGALGHRRDFYRRLRLKP